MATYKGRLDLRPLHRPETIGEVDLYRTGTVDGSNTRDDAERGQITDALAMFNKKLNVTVSPTPNDWEILIIAYREGEDGLEIAGTRG